MWKRALISVQAAAKENHASNDINGTVSSDGSISDGQVRRLARVHLPAGALSFVKSFLPKNIDWTPSIYTPGVRLRVALWQYHSTGGQVCHIGYVLYTTGDFGGRWA